jgi:hypothetical protein
MGEGAVNQAEWHRQAGQKEVFAGTERQCTEDEHDDEDEHDSQISEFGLNPESYE